MTPQHYPPSTATPTSKYSKAATESPSYRSTPDSRSSVLSRAREYTRRIEDENKRRSQSLDRHQQARLEQQQLNSNKNNLAPTPSRSHSRSHSHSQSQQGNQHLNHSSFESAVERQSVGTTPSPTSYRTARPTSLSSTGGSNRSPRSHSAGGGGGGGATSSSYFGNRLSTRERAMASVEKENSRGNNNNSYQYHHRQQQQQQQQQSSPATKVANTMSSNHYNGAPATTMSASSHGPHAEHRSQRAPHTSSSPSRSFAARRGERSNRGPGAGGNGNDGDGDEHQEHEAVVSPELLVDALSGHEDGLLAIAERLMEHYDSGYDAMGEAIIDAFADVQKLFQHVVEAAHMEGAAFEASRREEELALQKLHQQELNGMNDDAMIGDGAADNNLTSPTGPMRHDEFIDQDVKDCLNDAIRKGTSLKEQNQHAECYALYESACQSASSLLPVDSDHRGRLQLSIARAESMSPDRGCAILRYAMDDVLRSGLRAGKIPPPDISKRADVVLSKPKGHPSMTGSAGAGVGVVQSSEEALNSLVEEMKEIMDAPVYKDTPLQDVAKRFWAALQENKKISSKNEERLEHNLGKLKGDFLLARAEWEEKLNQAHEHTEMYKRKYMTIKDGKETSLMEEARSMMSQTFVHKTMEEESASALGGAGKMGSFRSTANRPEFQRSVESVASMGSNLAQHAKTLVGSFACAGNNERTGQVLVSERATEEWRGRRSAAAGRDNNVVPPQQQKTQIGSTHQGLEISNSQSTVGGNTPTGNTPSYTQSNRSFRETTTTSSSAQPPRHVDV